MLRAPYHSACERTGRIEAFASVCIVLEVHGTGKWVHHNIGQRATPQELEARHAAWIDDSLNILSSNGSYGAYIGQYVIQFHSMVVQ